MSCRPVGWHLALLPTLLLAPSDAALDPAVAEGLLRQAAHGYHTAPAQEADPVVRPAAACSVLVQHDFSC